MPAALNQSRSRSPRKDIGEIEQKRRAEKMSPDISEDSYSDYPQEAEEEDNAMKQEPLTDAARQQQADLNKHHKRKKAPTKLKAPADYESNPTNDLQHSSSSRTAAKQPEPPNSDSTALPQKSKAESAAPLAHLDPLPNRWTT